MSGNRMNSSLAIHLVIGSLLTQLRCCEIFFAYV